MSMQRQSAQSIRNERHYKLHHFLFEGRFSKLSDSARILYTLLADRMNLSLKNNWIDEEGNVFFIYTNEEIMEITGRAKATVVKHKKELKDYGLIDEVRQGLNKPNLLYLTVPALEPQGSSESELQEVQELNFKKFRNYTSRSSGSERDLDLHKQDLQKDRLIDCNAHESQNYDPSEIIKTIEDESHSMMVNEFVTMQQEPYHITSIFAMLERDFKNQLEPSIVSHACKLYVEYTPYDFKKDRLRNPIDNPTGLFKTCYNNALRAYKVSQNRKKKAPTVK